jgi:autotransporter-associated beta strand protein
MAMLGISETTSDVTARKTAIRIARDADDNTRADVFLDLPDGNPAYSTMLSNINKWYVTGGTKDEELILDFSHGNPLPVGGLTFDGGDASSSHLVLQGISGSDAVTFGANQVLLFGSSVISYTNATLVLGGANHYAGGTTVSSGMLTITDVNALPNGGSLTISGGSVVLASGLGVVSQSDGQSMAAASGVSGSSTAANLRGITTTNEIAANASKFDSPGKASVSSAIVGVAARPAIVASSLMARPLSQIAVPRASLAALPLHESQAKAHDTALLAPKANAFADELGWLIDVLYPTARKRLALADDAARQAVDVVLTSIQRPL